MSVVMSTDAMIRFSIEPTSNQAWLWRTIDEQGHRTASGLAPTKKLAAAMVIRHILDRTLGQAAGSGPLAAEAA
jgi:hypothetical protein